LDYLIILTLLWQVNKIRVYSNLYGTRFKYIIFHLFYIFCKTIFNDSETIGTLTNFVKTHQYSYKNLSEYLLTSIIYLQRIHHYPYDMRSIICMYKNIYFCVNFKFQIQMHYQKGEGMLGESPCIYFIIFFVFAFWLRSACDKRYK